MRAYKIELIDSAFDLEDTPTDTLPVILEHDKFPAVFKKLTSYS